MNTDFPIDLVITWVDGQDAVHKAKRNRFSDSGFEIQHDDIGGDTRFNSVGEIYYCVASYVKYAPFIRKIFIVTDSQNPSVEKYLLKYFPADVIPPIEIVDHKVIFRGYEKFLPVFNSLAIETMLWRIPDLSEHFIYANDDILLVKPTTVEDFFTEGKANAYGYWHLAWTARFLRKFRRAKDNHKNFSFRDSMLNSAILYKSRKFCKIAHTPYAMRKSTLAGYFQNNPEHLISNISHRFRHPSQFNPQVLSYLIGVDNGMVELVSSKGRYNYLGPKPDRTPDYVVEKIKDFRHNERSKFLCVNSLDQNTLSERRIIEEYIVSALDMKIL